MQIQTQGKKPDMNTKKITIHKFPWYGNIRIYKVGFNSLVMQLTQIKFSVRAEKMQG